MSHQLYFYLSETDIKNLFGSSYFIKNCGYLKMAKSGREIESRLTLDEIINLDRTSGIVIIDPSRKNNVVYQSSYKGIITYVQVEREEVVELFLSESAPGKIKAGRMYYTDSFYGDEGALQKKDSLFIEWADSLYKYMRKNLNYSKEKKSYFGRDAEELFKKKVVELVPHYGAI